jgi:hypothetical protein
MQYRVTLVKAQAHHIGAFQLKYVSHLPEGLSTRTHLEHSEGIQVPVPYGNLVNYAQQLAKEWGSDEHYVILRVQSSCTGIFTSRDPEESTQAIKRFLDALPPHERARLELATIGPPDVAKPDDAQPDCAV